MTLISPSSQPIASHQGQPPIPHLKPLPVPLTSDVAQVLLSSSLSLPQPTSSVSSSLPLPNAHLINPLPNIKTQTANQASHIIPPSLLTTFSKMKSFQKSQIRNLPSSSSSYVASHNPSSEGHAHPHSRFHPSMSNIDLPTPTFRSPMRGGTNAGFHSSFEHNLVRNGIQSSKSSQQHKQISSNSSILLVSNSNDLRFLNRNARVFGSSLHRSTSSGRHSIPHHSRLKGNIANPFSSLAHEHFKQNSIRSPTFFPMEPHMKRTIPSSSHKYLNSSDNVSRLIKLPEISSRNHHDSLPSPSTTLAFIIPPFVSVSSDSSVLLSSDQSVFPPEIPVSRIKSKPQSQLAQLTPQTDLETSLAESIPRNLPGNIRTTLLVDLLLRLRLYISVDHEQPEFIIH